MKLDIDQMLIVKVHLAGGVGHQNIVAVDYKTTRTGPTSRATVPQVIDLISDGKAVHTYPPNGAAPAPVYINRRGGPLFIESRSDSTRLNNLLSLA